MISDEGQMRAANQMCSAADTFAQSSSWLQDSLRESLIRLEEIISRFENSVDRLLAEEDGE